MAPAKGNTIFKTEMANVRTTHPPNPPHSDWHYVKPLYGRGFVFYSLFKSVQQDDWHCQCKVEVELRSKLCVHALLILVNVTPRLQRSPGIHETKRPYDYTGAIKSTSTQSCVFALCGSQRSCRCTSIDPAPWPFGQLGYPFSQMARGHAL